MKLSISLASRGRSMHLARSVARTLENIMEKETKLLVCLDEDDAPQVRSVLESFEENPHLQISVKPREDFLGTKYNRVMEEAPADVYLPMVDYRPHITPGFDTKVLEAASIFPDGIGFVYNHMANLSWPEIIAVTSGVARRMGFVFPPYWPFWFGDHELDDIAKMIGRIAVADVGLDTLPRMTQEKRDVHFWATFFDARIHRRRAIAHRIINDPEFQEPPWRKKLLLSHHILIEERSLIVNRILRDQHPPANDVLSDERAKRIRKSAVPQLMEMYEELAKSAA